MKTRYGPHYERLHTAIDEFARELIRAINTLHP